MENNDFDFKPDIVLPETSRHFPLIASIALFALCIALLLLWLI